jgi:uroporphyrinogen-III synthase
MSERADEARIAEVMAAKVAVACVGPVCAEAARSHGVPEPVVPERSRLGSMVWALAEHLESRRIVLHAHGPTPARLVLQGAVALVGAAKVRLSERERAVLGVLAGRAGAVVGRAELLRRVWGDPTVDAHVLEVTVGRLRRKLGDAGRMIRTVPRRGYRLDATREVPTASRP